LSADALAIFVKAPESGKVKTRLAEALGAESAAALYQWVGRRVVAQCVAVGPGYGTYVWFTPAGSEATVRSWLGVPGVSGFACQPSGGLGARMAAAFATHFAEGAGRVVLIGSDCPGVDRSVVGRAFQALERRDMVVGPARDGGFYLLGLGAAAAPALFRQVQWSTDGVLRQVMLNAARLGLSAVMLDELRDLDTLEDARALGLLAQVPASRAERAHESARGA
jgi:hypothetical protein